MLLLQFCPRQQQHDTFQIYIPLCFYFNSLSAACALRACNLHSTMLLLQLIRSLIILLPFLHLHSTMLLLQFNLAVIVCNVVESTFHYASTSIYNLALSPLLPHHLHSTMLLLQSVSFSSLIFRGILLTNCRPNFQLSFPLSFYTILFQIQAFSHDILSFCLPHMV